MLLNYSNVFGHLHTREFLSSKWYFEVKIQKILREISVFLQSAFCVQHTEIGHSDFTANFQLL